MAKRKIQNKKTLPLVAMEKLLKKAGAHRVSEDAKEALRDVLEEYSFELGRRANKFSLHAQRKTIRAEDIVLAQKHKDE
jgi:DNA-binding protein